jgi:sulfite oxidase
MRAVTPTRRGFLQATGLALATHRARADETKPNELFRVGRSPQNIETPISAFDRLITPTPLFFVRSHFGPPALDRSRTLTIDGKVKKSLVLSVEDLKKTFAPVTVTAVVQCAGNGRAHMEPRVPGLQWGHGAMGQAAFTGARLKDVLEKAGIAKDAAHIRVAGADAPPKPTNPAFVRSIPIGRALDPTTLIAWKMNGEDLTLAHGAPMRLVVPGWAGDHWVKWLVHLTAQEAEVDGFYMQTAYRVPMEPVAPGTAVPPEKMRSATTFPVKSMIGSPQEGAKTPMGKQTIVGIAFSGEAPIKHVEVSVDDGKTWTKAKLEGEAGIGRWQVFRHEVEKKDAGTMRAMARATDAKGNVQPEKPAWNPSGYFWNAWHAVSWSVG